ncbi:alpha/beta hydrolase [Kutzneria sp. NPDC052558]|uniref:alpha/beta hydrolase n=1 Tax=Kutzneria sp. NPDC052558 TaxID=3364121 RepID=UPI0037C5BAFC
MRATAPKSTTPLTFAEPTGLNPRGTLVVLPGRGEQPGLYERFGRRLATDAYRVHVLGESAEDVEIKALLDEGTPAPVVLVGSDTGALRALRLAAAGTLRVDGLVLAGLPDAESTVDVDADAEPELRASCPNHQKLLRDENLVRAGALADFPAALREPVDLSAVTVPVLGLHGDNDAVSPVDRARDTYAALAHGRLSTVADGRHDVLNAANHRSVAATVVLFLERLRLGPELPEVVIPT